MRIILKLQTIKDKGKILKKVREKKSLLREYGQEIFQTSLRRPCQQEDSEIFKALKEKTLTQSPIPSSLQDILNEVLKRKKNIHQKINSK